MISVLGKSQIFKGLDTSTLQVVQQNAHRQQLAKGQFFTRQGEPALFFYVLIRGHAKITQLTPDGHRVLIRYLGPGQEFGLVAVLSGFEYPTSVQAVEECEALAWEGELLAQLIERYPQIAFNALRTLAQQNQAQQRRYQELLTKRVEQRLAQAILRLAEQVGHKTAEGLQLDILLSRESLAEMVGTDIYTVSRLMSRWTRSGFIQADRQSVLLLRPYALARLASSD